MLQNKLLIILLFLVARLGLAQDPPPNIIVIITDQHTGKIMTQRGYNHISTPGIDKLVAEGTLFTKSYATYPVCTFSRKSMITGVMPHKLDDVTVATSVGKTMKDNGYDTGYFGKWHVGTTDMDDIEAWHGFESYYENYYDSTIYKRSTDFINEARTKPFFMITSYNNPHDACELARNISGGNDSYHDGTVEEAMDTASCPQLPFNHAIPLHEAEGHYGRRNQDPGDPYYDTHPTKNWTEVEWRQFLYGYDRLLEKVDKRIEDLIDELDSKGMLENTIIIYTSDHGDGRAAHKWNQKKAFYEESINIPFIVSWKGKTKAGVINDTTLVSSGLDLFPTILQLAGISTPSSLHGIDISAAALVNPTSTLTSRDYVVSEIEQRVHTGHTPGKFTGRMVVTTDYKYILFDKGVNREQLYDLTTDPGELSPVTDDPTYHTQLLDLRQKLKDWVSTTGDSFDVDQIVGDFETNAKLNDIRVNGQSIASFSPDVVNYGLLINSAGGVTLEATAVNSASTVTITPPTDLMGNELARTAEIVVVSEDTNTSLTYEIIFEVSSQVTLTPTRDTYVRGGIYADTNYGLDTDLQVKQGANPDFYRKTFLKFDVNNFASIESAHVRLYTTSAKAGPVTIYEMGSSWGETIVTWNSAPTLGTAITTTAIGSTQQYYEWDVTSYIQSNAGGLVSFGLYDPSADNSSIIFSSQEGSNPPELVIMLTSAPAVPSSLSAAALSASEIDLSWTDHADNETGYKVERKSGAGAFTEIASLGANVSTYSDTSLAGATAYTYRVVAYNASGYSNYSTEASATTSGATSNHTYHPDEDSYVRGGASASLNFGSDTELVIKQGSNSDFYRKSLIKFDLSSESLGSVNEATLRVFASSAQPCDITAYALSDGWSESTVTWNNAPSNGTSISAVSVSANNVYYEWDVTSYVAAQLAGDGVISFGLWDLTADSKSVTINSKEAGSNIPELVIETSAGARMAHGTIEVDPSPLVNIYPNPLMDGILYVDLPSHDGTKVHISITDIQGKMIYQNQVQNKNSIQIDTNSWLTKGLFVIAVRTDHATTISKLIVH
ncbi:DNRLRE domain-containing protein [Reichenbachiella carrageenanivorans]|uniref:DNRLRE domain-containing protein n=1 Tax=Reichenbachiella carrageenanivorans TaxID=2979869 RepID=A0ABY6CZR6_9BACT|nr:DNRLRE domain-containing protein [Reichenbachiella carrageenanivorans]UXX79405.1 DNRLRE domain-containing protein [Reichenbachiella carrageenanivorans]